MATANISTKRVILSPAEKKQLELMCNNPMNWSDGGYWTGPGKAPNCFVKENYSNTRIHSFSFSSDQTANKWNTEWEDRIRYIGHFATAVLTTAATLTTGGLAGITIGTLAAIFKDEFQAKVEYPKVEREWKYVLKITRTSKWSAHPMGDKGLSIETTGQTYDHTGKLHYNATKIAHFNFDDLPNAIAEKIAQMPSRTTSSVYK
jgi:hypothetical protein